MNDYGEIKLAKIESPKNFWALYEELEDDKSGFIHNRDTLLAGFKQDDYNLWGLEIEETDSMFNRGANEDSIFCKNYNRSLYLVPCLCITNKMGEIVIIWTHTRIRRMGFGRKMVNELSEFIDNLKPNRPLPESISFWKALGLI